jgi:hypothetical protein
MSRARPRFTRINPPLPAAQPNTFEVIVLGQLPEGITVTTYYYFDGGAALTSTSESGLANQWITTNANAYIGVWSSVWSMTSVKAQCLTSPSRMPAVISNIIAGTGPSPAEPSTVAIVHFRVSGIKGQAGRGHVSTGGVPTTWVTGSSLNSTATTPCNTFGTTLGNNLVVGSVTYVPMLVSRRNKQGPPLGASPLLNHGFRTVLGTVRRRKIGRGK